MLEDRFLKEMEEKLGVEKTREILEEIDGITNDAYLTGYDDGSCESFSYGYEEGFNDGSHKYD